MTETMLDKANRLRDAIQAMLRHMRNELDLVLLSVTLDMRIPRQVGYVVPVVLNGEPVPPTSFPDKL